MHEVPEHVFRFLHQELRVIFVRQLMDEAAAQYVSVLRFTVFLLKGEKQHVRIHVAYIRLVVPHLAHFLVSMDEQPQRNMKNVIIG